MRCQQLEYEEQVEKGILKRQLESAIREIREAEKRYEELLEKLRPLSGRNRQQDKELIILVDVENNEFDVEIEIEKDKVNTDACCSQ